MRFQVSGVGVWGLGFGFWFLALEFRGGVVGDMPTSAFLLARDPNSSLYPEPFTGLYVYHVAL